jgi:hypothetical protein
MSEPLSHRIATRLWLSVSERMWGFPAVLMPMLVQNFGPLGSIRWFARNMPTYQKTLREHGDIRGNLCFMVASMLNGCAYCVYAHGRALELHYFKTRDKLFPIDAHGIVKLLEHDDSEVLATLERHLTAAGLESEVPIVRRLYAIKLEGAKPRDDEAWLVHAIQMFDQLNYCAIQSQSALDDAHDPINKDAALKARYAEARLRAGLVTPPR